MRLPAVLLAVTCLAGAASAEDLSGTLQKVKETRKITLGYQEASVPFSYLDGNQKPVGFAMDICLKIVDAVKKQLGMPDITVDYVAVTWSNRIPLMVNGTLDLHCSATTNAPFNALADRATAELYASPEIEVLYRKWLESPTPPNGINYNVPVSQALRNAFKNPSSSADPDVYLVK